MRWSLPAVQSLTAGYADTGGFLALKGLFTSHVTGNFVTLGAALVFGSSGALAKTLALPMFCLAVLVCRLLVFRLKAAGRPALRSLLKLQLLLFLLVAGLAAWQGPFEDPDRGWALLVGMTLVAAMAMQNAAHRLHLAHTPPSTVMTGTTTQIMLDLAEILHGVRPEVAAITRARLGRLALSVTVFAAGCGLAALIYTRLGKWCFSVLPVLGLCALMLRAEIAEADTHK
ncbi:MAG TPA: YoaK family protein [Steroidobacteraceae bacterium]|nr:YoaK family protein [Steroidobacteraceae bacterium]